MKRNLTLIALSAALASTLTLLAVVGAGFYLGRLTITGPVDPLQLAISTEGSQLAVIYPVGGPEDVEQMERSVGKAKAERR